MAMRSDEEIKRDVEQELKWDPDIDATDIAVNVKNGVVTLTGFVRSYAQRLQAEADAKRVSGVLSKCVCRQRMRGPIRRSRATPSRS
jgi:osmotically-inducible protein OsmY